MGQKQQIIRQADQCVKCGLCLPHCPTYKIMSIEGYSPRGRISLIQGLADGQLSTEDEHVQKFLDTCLGCRYCETICPSQVEYNSLLDKTRAILLSSSQKTKSLLTRFSAHLLVHRKQLQVFYIVLWVMQRLGVLKAITFFRWQKKSRFQTLICMLPKLVLFKTRPRHVDSVEAKKRIALFIGCTGRTLGHGTLKVSIQCLQSLGYQVAIPENQDCCGLLHRHQGDTETADALIKQNIAAFKDDDTVLTFASGCQSALCEHLKNTDFLQNAQDIGQFLVENHFQDILDKSDKKTTQHVYVHRPCTQQYLQENGLLPLLKALPDVTVSVSENGQCCGAAGSYFLTQPGIASKLAGSIIDDFKSSGATVFLSSNIGCELHLRAQLSEIDKRIKVMHPIQFLMEKINDSKVV